MNPKATQVSPSQAKPKGLGFRQTQASLSRAKPNLWWIQREKPKHLSLKQNPTFDESKGKPPRMSLSSKGQLLMNPKANPNYISLSSEGQSLMNPRHGTQVSYSQSLTNPKAKGKPKYLALLCSLLHCFIIDMMTFGRFCTMYEWMYVCMYVCLRNLSHLVGE
jgi:hypothetical protein